MSDWNSRPRRAQFFYKGGDKVLGYAHIDADHKNCFFIVIFEIASGTPVGYLIFDIGAEYASPIYVCPAIDFEDEPTEAVIEESLPKLNLHKDATAVLDRGNGTYMQVYQEQSGLYTLEHQLVNTANHYRAVGEVDVKLALFAFNSYAFQIKEWARELKWEKVEI